MKLCTILFLAATLASVVRATETMTEEALKRILPAYAILSNIDVLNATECKRDLKMFHEAFLHRKLWSINLLDASGQPGPGFLNGNNFWMSSRDQCNSMKIPYPEFIRNISTPRDAAEEIPPFEVHYFTANFLHDSPITYSIFQPDENMIILGLCLPEACTTHEIAAVLNKVIRERILLFGEIYSTDIKLLEVKDLRGDEQWYRNGLIIGLGLVLFSTVVLIAVATVYDIHFYQEDTTQETKLISSKSTDGSSSESKSESTTEEKKMLVASAPQTTWGKVLLCFSARKNTAWIFDMKETPDSIPSLDGIRFLSMFWILTMHAMLYSGIFNENRIYGTKFLDTLTMHLMCQVMFCVDTFFFISGFLMSASHFKSTMNKGKKVISYRASITDYFQRLFKRYIRLTPTYALVLVIVTVSFAWQRKTSMFYLTEKLDENCSKYWWGNILYFNNLFDKYNMCMSWSWYLACDMQFYVVGNALLILSSVHFSLAVALLFILFIGTTAIAGYAAYVRNYTLTVFQLFNNLEDLYFPPWVRIGPYIVGIITGYILVKINFKLDLSKKAKVFCWCLAVTCTLFPAILGWQPQLSVLSSSIVFAVSRTLWSIGSAWLLVACCTNNGGIFARILSFKGWVPLSRLSFCAYLLNPYIIMFIYLNGDRAAHVDSTLTIIVALGINVLSYLLAYLFSILMEQPYRRLISIFLNSCFKKV